MGKVLLVERDIVIYALRYALGRRTFAPTVVSDTIKHNIDKFSKTDIELIIRDINEQKDLGDNCDIETWNNLKGYLKDRLR